MGRLSPFSGSSTLGLAIFILTFLSPNKAAPVQETAVNRYANEKGCYFKSIHYPSGQEIETNEPCLNCTCAGSTLMCYLRVCPFIKPLGENCKSEMHEGDCCPKYWCPKVYPHITTEAPETEAKGCYLDGFYYSEGDRLPINPLKPCEACYCIKNTSVCTMQTCELSIDGCFPQYKVGSCCPARYNCTDDAATTIPPGILEAEEYEGCSQDGIKYKDGEQVPSDAKCNQCYCMKHSVVCAVATCKAPAENCVPHETPDGECCPEKYDCPEGTEIPDYGTTHMITEEEFLNLTTTPKTPITLMAATDSVSDEDLASTIEAETLTTLESEVIYPTTKGIRRIDLVTTIATLESEEFTTEGASIGTDLISRPRVPKITEVPDEMFSTAAPPNVTTGKPIFYPSRPIPGEGICRHENQTYQNKEKVISGDPCRVNCTCINSVVNCEIVECVLERPKSFKNCKVKKTEGECCPKYVCDTLPSTPSVSETEKPESQISMDTFATTPGIEQQEIISDTMTPISEISIQEQVTLTHETEEQTIQDSFTDVETKVPDRELVSHSFEETSATEATLTGKFSTSMQTDELLKETTVASEDMTIKTVEPQESASSVETTRFTTKSTDITEEKLTSPLTEKEETKLSSDIPEETLETKFTLEGETKTISEAKTTVEVKAVTTPLTTEEAKITAIEEGITVTEIKSTVKDEVVTSTMTTEEAKIMTEEDDKTVTETKATPEDEVFTTPLITEEAEITDTEDDKTVIVTKATSKDEIITTPSTAEGDKITTEQDGEIDAETKAASKEEVVTTPFITEEAEITTIEDDKTVLETKSTPEDKIITTPSTAEDKITAEQDGKIDAETTAASKDEVVTTPVITDKDQFTVTEDGKTVAETKSTSKDEVITTLFVTEEIKIAVTEDDKTIKVTKSTSEDEIITTPSIAEEAKITAEEEDKFDAETKAASKDEVVTTPLTTEGTKFTAEEEGKTVMETKATSKGKVVTTPLTTEEAKFTETVESKTVTETMTTLKDEVVTTPLTTEGTKFTEAEEGKSVTETKTTSKDEVGTTTLTTEEAKLIMKVSDKTITSEDEIVTTHLTTEESKITAAEDGKTVTGTRTASKDEDVTSPLTTEEAKFMVTEGDKTVAETKATSVDKIDATTLKTDQKEITVTEEISKEDLSSITDAESTTKVKVTVIPTESTDISKTIVFTTSKLETEKDKSVTEIVEISTISLEDMSDKVSDTVETIKSDATTDFAIDLTTDMLQSTIVTEEKDADIQTEIPQTEKTRPQSDTLSTEQTQKTTEHEAITTDEIQFTSDSRISTIEKVEVTPEPEKMTTWESRKVTHETEIITTKETEKDTFKPDTFTTGEAEKVTHEPEVIVTMETDKATSVFETFSTEEADVSVESETFTPEDTEKITSEPGTFKTDKVISVTETSVTEVIPKTGAPFTEETVKTTMESETMKTETVTVTHETEEVEIEDEKKTPVVSEISITEERANVTKEEAVTDVITTSGSRETTIASTMKSEFETVESETKLTEPTISSEGEAFKTEAISTDHEITDHSDSTSKIDTSTQTTATGVKEILSTTEAGKIEHTEHTTDSSKFSSLDTTTAEPLKSEISFETDEVTDLVDDALRKSTPGIKIDKLTTEFDWVSPVFSTVTSIALPKLTTEGPFKITEVETKSFEDDFKTTVEFKTAKSETTPQTETSSTSDIFSTKRKDILATETSTEKLTTTTIKEVSEIDKTSETTLSELEISSEGTTERHITIETKTDISDDMLSTVRLSSRITEPSDHLVTTTLKADTETTEFTTPITAETEKLTMDSETTQSPLKPDTSLGETDSVAPSTVTEFTGIKVDTSSPIQDIEIERITTITDRPEKDDKTQETTFKLDVTKEISSTTTQEDTELVTLLGGETEASIVPTESKEEISQSDKFETDSSKGVTEPVSKLEHEATPKPGTDGAETHETTVSETTFKTSLRDVQITEHDISSTSSSTETTSLTPKSEITIDQTATSASISVPLTSTVSKPEDLDFDVSSKTETVTDVTKASESGDLITDTTVRVHKDETTSPELSTIISTEKIEKETTLKLEAESTETSILPESTVSDSSKIVPSFTETGKPLSTSVEVTSESFKTLATEKDDSVFKESTTVTKFSDITDKIDITFQTEKTDTEPQTVKSQTLLPTTDISTLTPDAAENLTTSKEGLTSEIDTTKKPFISVTSTTLQSTELSLSTVKATDEPTKISSEESTLTKRTEISDEIVTTPKVSGTIITESDGVTSMVITEITTVDTGKSSTLSEVTTQESQSLDQTSISSVSVDIDRDIITSTSDTSATADHMVSTLETEIITDNLFTPIKHQPDSLIREKTTIPATEIETTTLGAISEITEVTEISRTSTDRDQFSIQEAETKMTSTSTESVKTSESIEEKTTQVTQHEPLDQETTSKTPLKLETKEPITPTLKITTDIDEKITEIISTDTPETLVTKIPKDIELKTTERELSKTETSAFTKLDSTPTVSSETEKVTPEEVTESTGITELFDLSTIPVKPITQIKDIEPDDEQKPTETDTEKEILTEMSTEAAESTESKSSSVTESSKTSDGLTIDQKTDATKFTKEMSSPDFITTKTSDTELTKLTTKEFATIATEEEEIIATPTLLDKVPVELTSAKIPDELETETILITAQKTNVTETKDMQMTTESIASSEHTEASSDADSFEFSSVSSTGETKIEIKLDMDITTSEIPIPVTTELHKITDTEEAATFSREIINVTDSPEAKTTILNFTQEITPQSSDEQDIEKTTIEERVTVFKPTDSSSFMESESTMESKALPEATVKEVRTTTGSIPLPHSTEGIIFDEKVTVTKITAETPGSSTLAESITSLSDIEHSTLSSVSDQQTTLFSQLLEKGEKTVLPTDKIVGFVTSGTTKIDETSDETTEAEISTVSFMTKTTFTTDFRESITSESTETPTDIPREMLSSTDGEQKIITILSSTESDEFKPTEKSTMEVQTTSDTASVPVKTFLTTLEEADVTDRVTVSTLIPHEDTEPTTAFKAEAVSTLKSSTQEQHTEEAVTASGTTSLGSEELKKVTEEEDKINVTESAEETKATTKPTTAFEAETGPTLKSFTQEQETELQHTEDAVTASGMTTTDSEEKDKKITVTESLEETKATTAKFEDEMKTASFETDSVTDHTSEIKLEVTTEKITDVQAADVDKVSVTTDEHKDESKSTMLPVETMRPTGIPGEVETTSSVVTKPGTVSDKDASSSIPTLHETTEVDKTSTVEISEETFGEGKSTISIDISQETSTPVVDEDFTTRFSHKTETETLESETTSSRIDTIEEKSPLITSSLPELETTKDLTVTTIVPDAEFIDKLSSISDDISTIKTDKTTERVDIIPSTSKITTVDETEIEKLDTVTPSSVSSIKPEEPEEFFTRTTEESSSPDISKPEITETKPFDKADITSSPEDLRTKTEPESELTKKFDEEFTTPITSISEKEIPITAEKSDDVKNTTITTEEQLLTKFSSSVSTIEDLEEFETTAAATKSRTVSPVESFSPTLELGKTISTGTFEESVTTLITKDISEELEKKEQPFTQTSILTEASEATTLKTISTKEEDIRIEQMDATTETLTSKDDEKPSTLSLHELEEKIPESSTLVEAIEEIKTEETISPTELGFKDSVREGTLSLDSTVKLEASSELPEILTSDIPKDLDKTEISLSSTTQDILKLTTIPSDKSTMEIKSTTQMDSKTFETIAKELETVSEKTSVQTEVPEMFTTTEISKTSESSTKLETDLSTDDLKATAIMSVSEDTKLSTAQFPGISQSEMETSTLESSTQKESTDIRGAPTLTLESEEMTASPLTKLDSSSEEVEKESTILTTSKMEDITTEFATKTTKTDIITSEGGTSETSAKSPTKTSEGIEKTTTWPSTERTDIITPTLKPISEPEGKTFATTDGLDKFEKTTSTTVSAITDAEPKITKMITIGVTEIVDSETETSDDITEVKSTLSTSVLPKLDFITVTLDSEFDRDAITTVLKTDKTEAGLTSTEQITSKPTEFISVTTGTEVIPHLSIKTTTEIDEEKTKETTRESVEITTQAEFSQEDKHSTTTEVVKEFETTERLFTSDKTIDITERPQFASTEVEPVPTSERKMLTSDFESEAASLKPVTLRETTITPEVEKSTLEFETTEVFKEKTTISDAERKEISEKDMKSSTTEMFATDVITDNIFDVSTRTSIRDFEITKDEFTVHTSEATTMTSDISTDISEKVFESTSAGSTFAPVITELSTFDSDTKATQLVDLVSKSTEITQNLTEIRTTEITHELSTAAPSMKTENVSDVPEIDSKSVTLKEKSLSTKPSLIPDTEPTKEEEQKKTSEFIETELTQTTAQFIHDTSTDKKEELHTTARTEFSTKLEAVTEILSAFQTSIQTSPTPDSMTDVFTPSEKSIPTTTDSVKTVSTERDSTTRSSISTHEAETTTELLAEHTVITEETILSNVTFAVDAMVVTRITTEPSISSSATDATKITVRDETVSDISSTITPPATTILSTIINKTDISQDVTQEDISTITLLSETVSPKLMTPESGEEIITPTTSEKTLIVTTELLMGSEKPAGEEITSQSITLPEDFTSLVTDKVSASDDETVTTVAAAVEETTLDKTLEPTKFNESSFDELTPLEATSTPVTGKITSSVISDESGKIPLSTESRTFVNDEFGHDTREKISTTGTPESVSTMRQEISSSKAEVTFSTFPIKEEKTVTSESTTASSHFIDEEMTFDQEKESVFTSLVTESDVSVSTEKSVGGAGEVKLTTLLTEEKVSTVEPTEAHSDSELPEGIFSRRDEKIDVMTTEKKTDLSTEIPDITFTSTISAEIKTSLKSHTQKDVEDISTMTSPVKLVTETVMISDMEKDLSTTVRDVFHEISSTMSSQTQTESITESTISTDTSKDFSDTLTTKLHVVSTDIEEENKTVILPQTSTTRLFDATDEILKTTTKLIDEISTNELDTERSEEPKEVTEKGEEQASEEASTLPDFKISTVSVTEPSSENKSTTIDSATKVTELSPSSTDIVEITTASLEKDAGKPSETEFPSVVTEGKETKLDISSTTEIQKLETFSTARTTETYSEVTESTSSTATTVPSELITEGITTISTDSERREFTSETMRSPEIKTTSSTLKEDITPRTVSPDEKTLVEESAESTPDVKGDCIVNNTSYKDGEAIKTIDPCEKCHCSLGEMNCFKILCKLPKEGCIPNINSTSECCPSSYECPEDDKSKPFVTTSVHRVTDKDLTTPIPISFMFSTTPTSIASTQLITKFDESTETEEEIEEKQKTTIGEDVISIVSGTSAVTSEKTIFDGEITTMHPRTEVTEISSARTPMPTVTIDDLHRKENETSDKELETTVTPEEFDLTSEFIELKDAIRNETATFTEGETTEVSLEISTSRVELTSTLGKEEKISEVTKQTTETPTTFDTIRTTFGDTHKEKEDDTTLFTESTTTTTSLKVDQATKSTKLPDLITPSELFTTEFDLGDIKKKEETESKLSTTESAEKITEAEISESTMIDQKITEKLDEVTKADQKISSDKTSTEISELTEPEESSFDKKTTKEAPKITTTEGIQSTESETVKQDITFTPTSTPSKLSTLEELSTIEPVSIASTESDEEMTSIGVTSTSLRADTSTKSSTATFEVTETSEALIDLDKVSKQVDIISTSTIPGTVTSSVDTDATIVTLSAEELSTLETVNITTDETKMATASISTEPSKLTSSIFDTKEVTIPKKIEPSTEKVISPTDDGLLFEDDKFKTTSLVVETSTVLSKESTDFEIVSEILETNKTFTILDREGTVSTTDKESKLFTIPIPTSRIPEDADNFTTTDLKKESDETEATSAISTISDKIFTFVSTRFTDIMKEIDELTTVKADNETTDISTIESVTITSPGLSTEEIPESITSLIPLTRRIDLDMDRTTVKEQTSWDQETTQTSTWDHSTRNESVTKSVEVTSESGERAINDTETTSSKLDVTSEVIVTTIASATASPTEQKVSPTVELEHATSLVTDSTKEKEDEFTDATKGKEDDALTDTTKEEFSKRTEIPEYDSTEILTASSVTASPTADVEKSSIIPEVTTTIPLEKTDLSTEEVSEDSTVSTSSLPETPLETSKVSSTQDKGATTVIMKESGTEFTTTSDILKSTFRTQTTVSDVSLLGKTQEFTEEALKTVSTPREDITFEAETDPSVRSVTTEQGQEITESDIEVASRVTRKDVEFETTRISFTETEIEGKKDIDDEEKEPLQPTDLPDESIEKGQNTTVEVTISSEAISSSLIPSTVSFDKSTISADTTSEKFDFSSRTTVSTVTTEESVKETLPTISEIISTPFKDKKVEVTTPEVVDSVTEKMIESSKDITHSTVSETSVSEDASAAVDELSTKKVLTTFETFTTIAQDAEASVSSREEASTVDEITKTTEKDSVTDSSTESIEQPKLTTRISEKSTTIAQLGDKTTPEPETTTTIKQEADTITPTPHTEQPSSHAQTTDSLSPEASTQATREPFNTTDILTKGYKAIDTTPTTYTTAYPSSTDVDTTTVREEDDYLVDENTCIFGGRIYQSAEQIPRPDPCEFCFCFRGDIICLQQSCPPPLPNCDQTTIPGYCCPRYECPVYLTSKNFTQLSRRKGNTPIIIQKRIDKREIARPVVEIKGCQVNGTFYEMGKTVTSASGPCLHCVCQEDGLLHCDPLLCKPQPPLMLKMNNHYFKR